MSSFYKPYDNCVFLHASYIAAQNSQYGNDAIVACVKDITTNESKLHFIKNPMIQLYVTKEQFRNYTMKREYARMCDCDMVISPYKNQVEALAKALGIKYDPDLAFVSKKKIEASPFAYGWDISPLVRMKVEYLEHTQKSVQKVKIGMLDIETSVLGDEQILCASVCDWESRRAHCFILNNEWMHVDDTVELEKRSIPAYKEFEEGLNPKAKKIWEQSPIKPIFHLCENEKDLIVQLFAFIQSLKLDFLGIWNMGYDIPYIIKRAEFRQLELSELFCSPEVPAEFRCFEWHEDKSKVDHFTDTWHTVTAPGYTYYYDAMCLYSRLRKVQGRDVSYTLDYIGNKIIGSGKMNFGINESHYAMQTNDQIGYCVYNTLDTVIPALMDAVTTDVLSLIALSDCSMLTDFNKQTVQLKAQFYKYLKEKNCISGSVAGSLKQPTDMLIGNIGGAVLNPTLMKVKGLSCLEETNEKSSIYRLAADLDVSSFYPSVTNAFNVSRETKLASVVWVEGAPHTTEEIQKEEKDSKRDEYAKENAEYNSNLFGRIPCVGENAVAICHEHFGLPDYEEMLKLINK